MVSLDEDASDGTEQLQEPGEDLGTFKGAGDTWDEVVKDLIEARRKQNLREMLERTDREEYVRLEGG